MSDLATIVERMEYVFDYPSAFTTLPDYSAHRGQIVTVIRPLLDGVEYDGPSVDPELERMYRIRADDGWEGAAWESELSALLAAAESAMGGTI